MITRSTRTSLLCWLAFLLTASPLLRSQDAPPPGASTQFCTKDVPSEVVAFCNKLAWLQYTVNEAKRANPQITAAGLLPTLRSNLRYLNPGDFNSQGEVVSAVKNELSLLQFEQQVKQQLSQIASQPVSGQTIADVAQSTRVLRNDQQFSASSAISGATSLVTKAGSADILSLALDAGALTRTINGSTATLNANADELFRLITRDQPDCLMNCGNRGFENRFLNNLNFSGSFALAQSGSQSVSTTGQASGTSNSGVTTAAIPSGGIGKLTSFTARFQIINKFDPRSAAFQKDWKAQVGTMASGGATLDAAVTALYSQLQTDPAFKAAQGDGTYQQTLVNAAVSDPSGAKLVSEWEKIWAADTSQALTSPDVPKLVVAVVSAEQQFRDAWHALVDNVAGNMITAQYTLNKNPNQPETHDLTGVFARSWGDRGSLTVNGAVSIYNGTLPAGAKYGRIHYGQASAEYDNTLAKPTGSQYQADYSLAGYWQYQPQPSILNIPAGTVAPGTNIPLPNGTQEFVGTAGNLWVGQLKFTIRGPGGINIPIGGSWSNKTDLLQGTKLGAQVGISYDFSSISKLL